MTQLGTSFIHIAFEKSHFEALGDCFHRVCALPRRRSPHQAARSNRLWPARGDRVQPDRPDITRSVIIRWQGAPRASEFPTLLIVGITCRDRPDERDRRPLVLGAGLRARPGRILRDQLSPPDNASPSRGASVASTSSRARLSHDRGSADGAGAAPPSRPDQVPDPLGLRNPARFQQRIPFGWRSRRPRGLCHRTGQGWVNK
jgi:hypothetical protein